MYKHQKKLRPKKIKKANHAPEPRKWIIQIHLQNRKPKLLVSKIKNKVKNILSAMESEIPPETNELSITITTDSKIQILNKEYRNKNKATDVLSFPMINFSKNEFIPQTLGDLVISLDTAVKQAKKFGHSLTCELDRLIIHGILHLLGYDHEKVSASKAQKMRRKERRLLSALSNKFNI